MPIAQLNIPPGVVRGKTPLQTKGRYWDANLVRWRSGALIPVGGWQRITAAADLDSTCRTIFSWAVNTEQNTFYSAARINFTFLMERRTQTLLRRGM